MLARFSRAAAVAKTAVVAPARAFSDTFKDRETAAERDFINRAEREALQKILRKTATAESNKAAADALTGVLAANNVKATPELTAALKAWKESH